MHVSFSLNMGGLENVILNLCGGLNKGKFSQSVCVLSDELGLKTQFDESNIPVVSFSKKNGIDLNLVLRLKKFFRDNPADIVHTHNPTALLYGGLAAVLSGKKLVHTEHSNLMQGKKLMNFAESLLFRMVRGLVCDTEEVKQSVHKNQGISLDKIKVICNGVDVKKFCLDDMDSLPAGLPADRHGRQGRLRGNDRGNGDDKKVFTIGTVARLALVKDQKSMINAVQILKEKGRNVKLVIAGDGELKNVLMDHAKKCEVENCVEFLGERMDIADILKSFDAYVLCSLYEGMSVSLLEAMSSSLPCIVTNVGGNVELIKDGDNGFLIPVKDPDAISACVEKLIDDPVLCETMGQANRKLVEEKYSLRVMCREYEKIYEEVC